MWGFTVVLSQVAAGAKLLARRLADGQEARAGSEGKQQLRSQGHRGGLANHGAQYYHPAQIRTKRGLTKDYSELIQAYFGWEVYGWER